jgi:energy-coupling factor transporter transmembrane protein EcfT
VRIPVWNGDQILAELTRFCYQYGRSVLHGLDVRFKLLFLVMISLSSLKAHMTALPVLTGVTLLLLFHTNQSPKTIFVEIRYFFLILVFVFIARALTTPGVPVVEFAGISITREGLWDGILVCWRLSVIVMLSFLLVVTTRPTEIKSAVQWFLRPVPCIPEKRVATMMSLVMRFVPVILDQARETGDAQKARGVENRKNPFYRISKLMIPLIRRTFETADQLAVAMEARCYSENRTDPEFSTKRRDWLALVAVLCMCFLTIGL